MVDCSTIRTTLTPFSQNCPKGLPQGRRCILYHGAANNGPMTVGRRYVNNNHCSFALALWAKGAQKVDNSPDFIRRQLLLEGGHSRSIDAGRYPLEQLSVGMALAHM